MSVLTVVGGVPRVRGVVLPVLGVALRPAAARVDRRERRPSEAKPVALARVFDTQLDPDVRGCSFSSTAGASDAPSVASFAARSAGIDGTPGRADDG
jgi:hypothetical protein